MTTSTSELDNIPYHQNMTRMTALSRHTCHTVSVIPAAVHDNILQTCHVIMPAAVTVIFIVHTMISTDMIGSSVC